MLGHRRSVANCALRARLITAIETGGDANVSAITFSSRLLSGSGIRANYSYTSSRASFQRDLGGAIMWRCCARRQIMELRLHL